MTPSSRQLDRALRALAEAGPREAPPGLEARLLTAFRARARHSGKLQRWTLATVWAAAAAAAVLLVVPHAARRPASPGTTQAPVKARAVPSAAIPSGSELADGFVAVPDADLLAPVDYGAVVRVELPGSAAMRLLGGPVVGGGTGDLVQADLLVGQDGMARAIRIVEH